MESLLSCIKDKPSIYYMVFVNEDPVSGPLPNEKLARIVVDDLSPDLQPLAKIEPVTKNGKVNQQKS